MIKACAEEQRKENNGYYGQVGIDAKKGEKPKAKVGEENDNRALRNEDNPHGSEYQAESYSGCPIHGPEKNTVDQSLYDDLHQAYHRLVFLRLSSV